MNCPKCKSNVKEKDTTCPNCGFDLKRTASEAPPSNVKIAVNGLCPHCYKPFSPNGTGTLKLLKLASLIIGILFGFFAFLSLILLIGGEGSVWIFALIFGALLLGVTYLKKMTLKKMHYEACPHCGKNYNGEQIASPAVEEINNDTVNSDAAKTDTFTAKEELLSAPVSAKNLPLENDEKTCARCRARNTKSNRACTECGFVFGRIIPATDGKNKFGITTCPGCGSVYQVSRNTPFIVIFALLGIISLFLPMPVMLFFLNFVLAAAFFGIAVLHYIGKLQFLSIKKCTVCHKTALSINIKKHTKKIHNSYTKRITKYVEKRDQKLVNRRINPFIKTVSSINNWIEKHIGNANPFPFGIILSTVLFAIAMFITNDAFLYFEGIEKEQKSFLYLEAIINFGNQAQTIPLIILPFLFIGTFITNFRKKLRLNGFGMVAGFLTAILEIILAIANTALANFKYYGYIYGERIKYDGYYSTNNINAFLIISAIILVLFVLASYLIEKEKHYTLLKSKATESAQ